MVQAATFALAMHLKVKTGLAFGIWRPLRDPLEFQGHHRSLVWESLFPHPYVLQFWGLRHGLPGCVSLSSVSPFCWFWSLIWGFSANTDRSPWCWLWVIPIPSELCISWDVKRQKADLLKMAGLQEMACGPEVRWIERQRKAHQEITETTGFQPVACDHF